MPSRRYWKGMAYRFAWRLRPLARPPWRQVLAVGGIVGTVCIVSYALPQASRPASGHPAVVTASTDHPDEHPVATYHSNATGTQPKYLRLPSIKTEGFIQAVGVDQHHQVAVPTNIHLAGWFEPSATPGEPGLSIIDGHLDGRTQPGIFAHLAQLRAGDIFTVERANGAVRRFRVATVQSLPTGRAADLLFSQTPGVTNQLNLITCGGIFDESAHSYDHRVIVTAQYVPGK